MNELKICGYMRKYQVCREYAIERIKWEEALLNFSKTTEDIDLYLESEVMDRQESFIDLLKERIKIVNKFEK